ncbi:MAG: zinc-binding dehydrogenase, partial [Thermodesulfobacteriota bacterium]
MTERSWPKTMKAAVLAALNEPLLVEEVELPDSLDIGQVMVRVLCSGICGSQLGEIEGIKGQDRYLPHLLGHEGSGVVIETGPGVRFVRPGDHVVLHWRKGRGLEAAPPSYRWRGERLNAGWVTTFNEYAVVSENRLTPIPQDFDPALASLFGCAVTTGLGVVANNARVKPGQSVVVFGAGGVGLNVIQGAALCTAHPIVAVDLFDHRLSLARRFGATHLVNNRDGGAEAAVREIVGPDGADVVVDNTGRTDVIAAGYQLTHSQGRLVLVGVPRAGDDIRIHSLPLHFGRVITGSHGGESNPAEDIPRYLNLHRAGKLELAGFITARYPLEEVNTAISDLRSGRTAGRC